jgi:hypothetical protein
LADNFKVFANILIRGAVRPPPRTYLASGPLEAALRSGATGIFSRVGEGNEIDVPAALFEAVAKRDRIADWKSLYDELKAAHQREQNAWRATDEAKDRLASSLQARIRELEAGQADSSAEKPLGAKERESLLKIVIGIAVDSYKYDPKLSRSAVPQEIADDLAKCGVVLDVDTVRKWLREAAELLPPKRNE